jgi:large subunit ribosomal protein L5
VPDQVKRVQGMDIIVVTTARTDEEARRLLALLGVPFKRAMV